MAMRIKVLDENTGEVLEDIGFGGGYNIQYADNEDSGRIKKVTKLDNARFSDKHWIKNYLYRPIAERLVEKFEELGHIRPQRILFLEDTKYTKKVGKKDWIARVRATNNELCSVTGYHYIIETREDFTRDMSREQIIALIYHELRHIDTDGSLVSHDIEDWSNMVASLGVDWAATKSVIWDLLDDDFEWDKLRGTRQVNMFEEKQLRAVK